MHFKRNEEERHRRTWKKKLKKIAKQQESNFWNSGLLDVPVRSLSFRGSRVAPLGSSFGVEVGVGMVVVGVGMGMLTNGAATAY